MQRLSELTAPQWLKAALIAILLFAVFQSMIGVGQITAAYVKRHTALDYVEQRVGLDTAFLDVGNQTLNTPVNEAAVAQYISRFNTTLSTLHYPIAIHHLQHVAAYDPPPAYTVETTLQLQTAEQEIRINVGMLPLATSLSLHPFAILAALLLTPLMFELRLRSARSKAEEKTALQPPEPKLVIDMTTKSIGNGVDSDMVVMQNKPFCFYAALVRFCIENPQATLPQNKDVPQPLIILANRVFLRLIELGHTKRKKPDFNANLDKTLSEIRATLDEVFSRYPTEKEKFYPPRAQGEGSRSKQHSYALPPLNDEDIVILGK
ncbi:hypothetical protein [Alteromonas sp. C1M14]|uniref:hypothetical protein n=1 Tax=Alteromonas sp. C1M14 TaxID=2841567 RepID=UPI001C097878|nr:hypothetical protein [Alteromonas sp. C1M14]MBU2976665.1 hypothetical protein [Alteromonas sp. C1M14]